MIVKRYEKEMAVNNRLCAYATVCAALMKQISLETKWHGRFISLLEEYPTISLDSMGIGGEWKNSEVWK